MPQSLLRAEEALPGICEPVAAGAMQLNRSNGRYRVPFRRAIGKTGCGR
jgi:hypothetical protein